MKKIHEDNFTVYYENTDSSGFTYHTSYLCWAERSRSNLLRLNFPETLSFLQKNSFFFVVKQIKVDFLKPSTLFDALHVETFFVDNSFTSIELLQKLNLKKKLICKINVFLVWIDGESKKPSKIPNDIISRFKSLSVV